jgi:hypothetical protein
VTISSLWRRQRTTVLGAAVLACVVALLAGRPLPGPVPFELGSFDGAWCREGWQRAERGRLLPEHALDDRLDFYYRVAGVNSRVALPLIAAPGPLQLRLRGRVPVRSAVRVSVAGRPAGERILTPEPWDSYALDLRDAAEPRPLELAFALVPLPLVRGDRAETPLIEIDYLEVDAAGGLSVAGRQRLLAVLAPVAILALLRLAGFGAAGALIGAALSGVLTIALLRAAPLATSAALPRLLPLALAAGLATHALLRRWNVPLADRRWLTALVAAGTAFHGSLVFFPDHSPPDIDIHVRRTADLAAVPLEYQALLRYASQLPTASQDRGEATAALGAERLIPYSPLPYALFFAVSRLGIDLYWGLTTVGAALAMLLTGWLWLVSREVWNREAAWLAALLYALDLAVWHHVGRAHAPAVIGGVLGTAALLYLLREAGRIDSRRRVLGAGVVLALGVLGYSSLAVLFGLFGTALLALLVADARPLERPARLGTAAALVTGGLIAGALYYFHYLPGFLGGAAGGASPDLFPGRTFFIFHNESRQSYRIWRLGYWIPLLAGLLAMPWALRAARPRARHVLIAWMLAWGMIMLIKEPWLFPRLLRWAKEDQFLSPLLCLLVGGAVAAAPRPWPRRALGAAAILTALWIQLRDFGLHADSLRL